MFIEGNKQHRLRTIFDWLLILCGLILILSTFLKNEGIVFLDPLLDYRIKMSLGIAFMIVDLFLAAYTKQIGIRGICFTLELNPYAFTARALLSVVALYAFSINLWYSFQ